MNTVEVPASIAFRVHPIPSRVLADIHLAGRDLFGNDLTPIVDEEGGAPLRCCLRRTVPGEMIYLLAYSPFTRPGPYAEVGPVFVHASPCPGYRETDAYPAGYRDWPTMVFRPYRHHVGLDCDAIAYDAIQMGEGATAEPEALTFRHPTPEDQPAVLAVLDDWWGGLEGASGVTQARSCPAFHDICRQDQQVNVARRGHVRPSRAPAPACPGRPSGQAGETGASAPSEIALPVP